MTMSPTIAPIDRVRADINAVAPSAQTLRHLRALLGLESSHSLDAPQYKSQKALRLQKPSKIPPAAKGTSKRKEPKTPDLKASNPMVREEAALENPQKLATEVFNTTLKQLGLAAKTAKGSLRADDDRPSVRLVPTQRPLNERSPNRGKSSCRNDEKRVESQAPRQDWSITADCALLALQYLVDAAESQGAKKFGQIAGLENASLILLDRTITLGLITQAQSQAYRIFRQYWSSSINTCPCPVSQTPSPAQCLLGRPDSAKDRSIFGFSTSMQSQMLRLMIQLGPTCINSDLVTSLKLETIGSPAWVCLQGLQETHLNAQQTGNQLRTISLAISKLYSLANRLKATCSSLPDNVFELFGVAMSIKFGAWEHLHHKFDPAVDFWQHFVSATRRYIASSQKPSCAGKSILHLLRSFRHLLKASGQDDTPPADLLDLLLQAARHLQCEREIYSLAGKEGTQLDPIICLVSTCQVTSSRLASYASETDVVLASILETRDLFSHPINLPLADLERVLLHAVQVRKALLYVIQDIQVSRQSGKSVTAFVELEYNSFQLIFCCVRFLFDQIQKSLVDGNQNLKSDRKQIMLAILIKNADSLIQVEKCCIIQASALLGGSNDALEFAIETVAFLKTQICVPNEGDALSTALSQIQVRISQAYWARYIQSVEARADSQKQIQILENSISAVASLSVTDKKSAFLCLKYQRLASCYADLHDFKTSKLILRKAIELDIELGSLHDATELALGGPSQALWSKTDSNCESLGRSLAMFANMALGESVGTNQDILLYDSSNLPPVQRAVLLERQVCCILERGLGEDHLLGIASHLQFLLPILDQPKYKVFRLRLVSSVISARLKKNMTVVGTLLTSQQIRSVLDGGTSVSQEVYLSEFESSLRTILQLQHDICIGQLSSVSLACYLKTLGGVIVECKTLDSFRRVIDDPDGFINLLHLCVGYANMLENHRAAHAALEMIRSILDLGHQSPNISKTSVLVQIGRSHMQMQNSESAHTALNAAQVSTAAQASDILVEIDLALTFAEQYFARQEFGKCSSHLERARSLWESRTATQTTSNHKLRLKEQTLLCTSAYLTSRLAFYQGNLLQAAICARQAVKVIAAVWLSISKVWASHGPVNNGGKDDSGIEVLNDNFSKLDLSSSHHSGRSIASTVVYWQEISLYYSAFSYMATLLVHCGLYCDAVYFYEQALKIAIQANLPTIVDGIRSELALAHARAGQLEKARVLRNVPGLITNAGRCLRQRLTVINQAEVEILLGDIPTACQLLMAVKNGNAEPKTEETTRKVKTKTVHTLPRVRTKTATPKPRTATKRVDQPSAKSPEKALEATIDQKILLDRLAMLHAHLRLYQGNKEVATLPAADFDGSKGNPSKVMFDALFLIRSALRLFSEDAVNNVLAETAVALPVRYKSSRKSGRISFVQDTAAQDSRPKRLQGKSKASGAAEKEVNVPGDGRALLHKAYQTLADLRGAYHWQIPSEAVHTLHKLLSQAALLSTALGDSLVPSSVEVLADALSPLDQLRSREMIITSSEMATSANSAISDWPHIRHSSSSIDSMEPSADLVGTIELLPETWSVVSIGLTKDRTELLVARISRHRSPFVIRIPLTRPDPSAMDHEELDFDSAKAELEDIVLAANTSAHDSRGCSADKTVRKAWFAERLSLDSRLAALLDNIENIWFGGFRGLLSAKAADAMALARFAQSLSNTLGRHLPSRQKPSKAGKAHKVELHSHVLELFLTLGHPRETDLEDSVTDLIYFVVDVLQFNGENNAYDEIDFDAMLVEILDALHAYHEGTSSNSLERENSHVILLVDKQLQAFPWESLPCMRGRSVSRMPSLGAIWERLEKMGDHPSNREGYVVSASEGTYILNPSSDLVSTEETFRSVFEAQLPGFKAIVNRSPTETEFETALQDSPLVLYFGHGGGAQYIRGRTIRKLQQCAVTLLMGCSSAKLSECGVYESNGMPWNYINGGSAAVVGTLWDVTDRDIDRFAMETMSEWGLVNQADITRVVEGKKKAARNQPSKSGTQKTVKMSLDQAIARARDRCLLKYLNGAAPVMYGIPVFLE
ncbi:uncharacterized protein A1O9_04384 [Exophiala aquamarina CBS 119918]|uniref:separase n=1 Tax=Exophiala aquamarina CBS 119918 TaxID=1182545 RepID=A0A072PVD5_9EURO|nr:uncharacterized protein A1O9_04384 [Exophiala aquamarina CBS 119918]KEF59540.1 hypothetical protein A1O9_04384 [Exophiala aquamarina CBS 119918]